MRRRGSFVLVSLLLAGTLAGCVQPDPPTIADDPLGEVYRVQAPVPAPPAGHRRWAFTDIEHGVIAQGRKAASLDFETGELRWARELPAAYAATDANRPLTGEGFLVLPGGGAASATSVRVLSLADGATTWERKLPGPGRLIVAGSSLEAVVIHVRCDARACDLTAMLLSSGEAAWKVRTAEPITLVDGRPTCVCLYAVGRRAISQISPVDGRDLWTARTPPGPLPVLVPSLYRLTVITPPAGPGCRATLRGLEQGKQVWTRQLTWQDAAVEREPCAFDPARILLRYGLFVPAAGRVTIVDEYHGTGHDVPLRSGEQVVAGDLAWSRSQGYRCWLDRPMEIEVPDPATGRPWGEAAAGGWLLASGPGVILFDRQRGVRWRSDTATAVLTHGSDRLIYQDGDDLVALGPRATPTA